MTEIKEILYQWCQGRSPRAISKSLGAAKNTIKKFIKEALQLGLNRTDDIKQLENISEKIEINRNTKIIPGGQAQTTLAERHEQLKIWKAIPDMTVVQMNRLLKEDGLIIGESSIRRYLKNHFPQEPDITMVLKTIPGRQAQVDFGYVGMMFDPVQKKKRKANAFIMTLAHSRLRFVRFVFRQDVETWIDCHIRAFEFFGGVPETVLLDNLKSGVIKPHTYDPTINRAYAELERHYGFVADPAKVRTPEHKGKVERSVPIVRQQLIAGRDYSDINVANDRALRWGKEEIAHVITRTTGETPWARFERDEKPVLKPLPETAFENSTWAEALVHRNCHIVFRGSFYSVPYVYVGQDLWIRKGARLLQIFVNGRIIKTHVFVEGKGLWATDPSDYPDEKQGFIKKDSAYCLEKAKSIGSSVHAVLERLITNPSITLQRKSQAIIRLSEKYGNSDVNAACKHALIFGNLEYQSIKTILENSILMGELVPKRSQPSQLTKGAFLRSANEFSSVEVSACI